MKKPKPIEFDEKIMNKLLSEDGVRQNVLKMTAQELDLFKTLLVTQGTYKRYCKEKGFS